MSQNYICQTASIDDLSLMMSWAKNENWNPGLHDHIPFQLADPHGFFMGYLGNKPIASISTIRYQNNFAFLGFYIVAPEYRGQGLGLQLWQHAIKYLSGYNIGLDGVIDQQDNYKKSGFKLAHRNIRFSGQPPQITEKNSTNIRTLPFNLICDYDATLFPSPRPAFLAAWLNMPQSNALAVIENNQIRGYGVIRRCYEGYKIAPLFAENTKIAKQLFLALCHYAFNEKIYLDVPEINHEALKIAEEFNLKPIFETARMYTQSVPTINMKKIFGITSFELG